MGRGTWHALVYGLQKSWTTTSVSHFSHSIMYNPVTPTDCSMPGFPLVHQLLELAQILVHRIADAINTLAT